MANLKRNLIELVTEVKEDKVETKRYLTPVFIPLSIVYEAIDLIAELEKSEKTSERDQLDKLLDFVANRIYKDQFTRDDLEKGLHAPEAIQTLQNQILFVARGMQDPNTKKLLAKIS